MYSGPPNPAPSPAQHRQPESSPPKSLETSSRSDSRGKKEPQSQFAAWASRHTRTLRLSYHIVFVFLLLTGAIVTAGILVVKEASLCSGHASLLQCSVVVLPPATQNGAYRAAELLTVRAVLKNRLLLSILAL